MAQRNKIKKIDKNLDNIIRELDKSDPSTNRMVQQDRNDRRHQDALNHEE
jgi:hypothetical protein